MIRDVGGAPRNPAPRNHFVVRIVKPTGREDWFRHPCYRLYEVREMGGAPRNPAPRLHLLVRIVKPTGRHCADWALDKQSCPRGSKHIVARRPPSEHFTSL